MDRKSESRLRDLRSHLPKNAEIALVASAGPEIGALGLFGAARASQRGRVVRPQKSLAMEI